jgi:hypothetical protein
LIAHVPDQRVGGQFSRRTLLIGTAASFICAPAVVRAASLMPIRAVIVPIRPVYDGERHYAGFVERLSYQMMARFENRVDSRSGRDVLWRHF